MPDPRRAHGCHYNSPKEKSTAVRRTLLSFFFIVFFTSPVFAGASDAPAGAGQSDASVAVAVKTRESPAETAKPKDKSPGILEITVATTVEKRATQTTYLAPLLEVAYYWKNDLMLDFILPWVVFKPDGEKARSGLGNMLAGVKWQFLDEKKLGFSASVYPRLEFNSGPSAANRGIVSEGNTLTLPLQVAKTFGPFGAAVEVGYELREYDIDESVYSLGIGYELSRSVELIGVVVGFASRDYKESEASFSAGVRWRFARNTALLASAGRGLYDSTGNEIEFFTLFGLEFTY